MRGSLDASVPDAAARMLHGSARRVHRASAIGPRSAAKIGFKARVDGPVAAQVIASPDEATLYVTTLGPPRTDGGVSEGHLVALARADGSERWSVSLGDRAYATPLVHDDGTIYVGSDAKKLFALKPSGESVFRLDTDGEVDTGAAFAPDGTIVFAAGLHVVAARRRGDVAWRFAARGKIFTAPAIAEDGLVVVGSQDNRVYGLRNGTPVWSTDLKADVDGAPVIGDDGGIYVGTDAAEVVKLDSSNGAIRWRTPVGGYVRGALSIARNGDIVTGTYGPAPRVVRLDPENGAIRGAFSVRGTGAREFGIHGGPLEDAEGALYFGAQDDAVYAIGPDGALRWRFVTGGDVDAPLTMLSDGSLVVPSEDGTVTLLVP